MQIDSITFLGLFISGTSIFMLMFYLLNIKKKTQLHTIFIANCILTFIWVFFLIMQIILSPLFHIEPIRFDNFVYIGICFLPVSLMFTGIIFANTKIKWKKLHFLVFLIPILSLLILWTNDFHHLFYEQYSVNFREVLYGPYFIIHSIYSYLCIAIGLWFLISYTIKNSGFFSKQSLLIILGTIIPTTLNILATFGILDLSIYVTPITYIITLLCYAIAMFKLQLFKATPIALQRIVDNISDSYLVLDDDNKIIDFNKTFTNTFSVSALSLRNISVFDFFSSFKNLKFSVDDLKEDIKKTSSSQKTITHEVEFHDIHKFFVIEITGIYHRNAFLGTILLFKDTTQHVVDLETIKENQDKLMEKERLASLGQLIGGIAHNLKTPIMSISGASEGLTDLIKEYDSSIGDPEVTTQDHHDIAHDMFSWVEKIRSYTEYMSDVITVVKGQAITLSDNQSDTFTIEELVKRIDILMKHELQNAFVSLSISLHLNANTLLTGNINSLVQVLNNMISNSIQAYNGAKDKKIDLIIEHILNNLSITIRDYAGGLPEEVEKKLFKEMITTKGKNGTGLGLFMSYSNIRAHFNGNITFESQKGVGTSFHVILPL